jgi:hypothetical protein
MTVTFQNFTCDVVFSNYRNNNRIAIQLMDTQDGQPVATATVNMVDYTNPVAQDEVFIKDYSENAGIAHALERAGIIKRSQKFFGVAEICRLTERAMDECIKQQAKHK